MKTYKHVTLEIVQDEDAPDPTVYHDLLGHMIFFHRRAQLGHKHNFTPESFREFVNEQDGKIILVPVYAYEHGGITIRAGSMGIGWDSWDSGLLGYVYALADEVRKEYGGFNKRAKQDAANCMAREIEIYNDYLNGNCWGYIVKDNEGETLDSCWGYIGDSEYCKDEGERSADEFEAEIEAKIKREEALLNLRLNMACKRSRK